MPPTTPPKPWTRRRFLHTAGGVLAAGSLARLEVARFAHAAGSDTLRVGLIGCGGRGTSAAGQILAGPGIRLTAVGDLQDERLRTSLSTLQAKSSDKLDAPRERQFTGFDAYQRVIDAGVDVVILTTPPAFRAQHFEAAVKAGKHCFLEKAVAVDAPGVRQLLAASELAKTKGLTAFVGYQRRFQPGYQAVVAKIHEGAIGELNRLEAYWRQSGQVRLVKRADLEARKGRPVTELEYQLENWMYFTWLCGDLPTDPLTHNLDICHWVMRDPPQSVRATVERRQLGSHAHGDVSDFFSAEYTYTKGATLTAESFRLKGGQGLVAEIAHGSKGSARCQEHAIVDGAGQTIWKQPTTPAADSYQREQDLLIESIRNDRRINMVDDAAQVALTAIMGRTAAILGRPITRAEMLASTETFLPAGPLTWESVPPTLPDKFGDYAVPARGRSGSAPPRT